MIDKQLLNEIRKFVSFALIVYGFNFLLAKNFHENLFSEVNYVQGFCIILFGGLILTTKVLVEKIPDFVFVVLLAFIGIKIVAAALFILLLVEFSDDHEHHVIIVFMTNYFIHLAYSTKKIVGYIQK